MAKTTSHQEKWEKSAKAKSEISKQVENGDMSSNYEGLQTDRRDGKDAARQSHVVIKRAKNAAVRETLIDLGHHPGVFKG